MPDLSKLGQRLVEQASAKDLPKIHQTTALLPYMLVAAKTMSMREISAFLSRDPEVSISAATVSRALRSKHTHLEKIAEFLEMGGERLGDYFRQSPQSFFSLDELNYPQPPHPLEEAQMTLIIKAEDASKVGEFDAPEIALSELVDQMVPLWLSIPFEVAEEIHTHMFNDPYYDQPDFEEPDYDEPDFD